MSVPPSTPTGNTAAEQTYCQRFRASTAGKVAISSTLLAVASAVTLAVLLSNPFGWAVTAAMLIGASISLAVTGLTAITAGFKAHDQARTKTVTDLTTDPQPTPAQQQALISTPAPQPAVPQTPAPAQQESSPPSVVSEQTAQPDPVPSVEMPLEQPVANPPVRTFQDVLNELKAKQQNQLGFRNKVKAFIKNHPVATAAIAATAIVGTAGAISYFAAPAAVATLAPMQGPLFLPTCAAAAKTSAAALLGAEMTAAPGVALTINSLPFGVASALPAMKVAGLLTAPSVTSAIPASVIAGHVASFTSIAAATTAPLAIGAPASTAAIAAPTANLMIAGPAAKTAIAAPTALKMIGAPPALSGMIAAPSVTSVIPASVIAGSVASPIVTSTALTTTTVPMAATPLALPAPAVPASAIAGVSKAATILKNVVITKPTTIIGNVIAQGSVKILDSLTITGNSSLSILG